MNNNMLLLGLLFGALILLRRPNQRQQQSMQPSDLGVPGYMGGEGTGYGIDFWGDEG